MLHEFISYFVIVSSFSYLAAKGILTRIIQMKSNPFNLGGAGVVFQMFCLSAPLRLLSLPIHQTLSFPDDRQKQKSSRKLFILSDCHTVLSIIAWRSLRRLHRLLRHVFPSCI